MESKLKSERIRLGLTQQQMSDLTGIPRRTLQSWEEGQRKCPDYVERLLMESLHRGHGQWISHGLCNPKCSVCNKYGYQKDNYCPNCGAKMDK